uniref:Proteasome subunit beta type-2-B n=1 Tax=Noccaea caerulescens TaxID=107243 RepID=A0A1J3JK20_NOCCA
MDSLVYEWPAMLNRDEVSHFCLLCLIPEYTYFVDILMAGTTAVIELVDQCILEIRSRLLIAPPNFVIKIVLGV